MLFDRTAGLEGRGTAHSDYNPHMASARDGSRPFANRRTNALSVGWNAGLVIWDGHGSKRVQLFRPMDAERVPEVSLILVVFAL